jgi:hypothetical protein
MEIPARPAPSVARLFRSHASRRSLRRAGIYGMASGMAAALFQLATAGGGLGLIWAPIALPIAAPTGLIVGLCAGGLSSLILGALNGMLVARAARTCAPDRPDDWEGARLSLWALTIAVGGLMFHGCWWLITSGVGWNILHVGPGPGGPVAATFQYVLFVIGPCLIAAWSMNQALDETLRALAQPGPAAIPAAPIFPPGVQPAASSIWQVYAEQPGAHPGVYPKSWDD